MKNKMKLDKTNFQQLVIVGVLFVIIIALSLLKKEFLTVSNILNVLRQSTSVIIAGCAITLLMISGNFDLSIGSTLALAGTMSAVFVTMNVPLWLSIVLSLLLGMVIGLVNGIMVINMNVPSIIATLGTMYSVRGAAWVITGGNSVHMGLGDKFTLLGRGYVGPIPLSLIITAVIFALFYFVQKKTLLGKYAYAIGANKRTALLSGINVKFYGVTIYVLVGLLAAFAGVMTSSLLGVGNAGSGVGFEFDVIVAVVLGGTSLAGGVGSIFGTLIGALIVGFIANGLNILGVHSFYQDIVKGIVLVGAVLLDMSLKFKLSKS